MFSGMEMRGTSKPDSRQSLALKLRHKVLTDSGDLSETKLLSKNVWRLPIMIPHLPKIGNHVLKRYQRKAMVNPSPRRR